MSDYEVEETKIHIFVKLLLDIHSEQCFARDHFYEFDVNYISQILK